MKSRLRQPFLHFLLLGSAIFVLNEWRQRPEEADAKKSQRIEINAAVIQRLQDGWARQFGRSPDAAELRGQVEAHIREEVLAREALALGLDQEDTIVRRRLAQKMEFLTADLVTADPAEQAVQEYFAAHASRYARPARLTFRHVYFRKEKHGTGTEARAAQALTALNNGVSDETLGDPFLHGFEFAARDMTELTSLFGPGFGETVAAGEMGKWRGPVPSSYGLHLVRVEARSAVEPVTLAQVRDAVVRDLKEERRNTADLEVFEQFRARYEVIVDEAALQQTSAPGVVALQK